MRFEAKITNVGKKNIVRLPEKTSRQLSSRGMVLVEGTIGGRSFKTVLEPDGRGGHWFETDTAKANQLLEVEIDQSNSWPEPSVPSDLMDALKKHPKAHELWVSVTPMARWDWIRWIRATNNSKTRQHRIEVAVDKLKKGTRRPCCFNRTMCTFPEVSKGGVLLD